MNAEVQVGNFRGGGGSRPARFVLLRYLWLMWIVRGLCIVGCRAQRAGARRVASSTLPLLAAWGVRGGAPAPRGSGTVPVVVSTVYARAVRAPLTRAPRTRTGLRSGDKVTSDEANSTRT
jgi:hypothetical protein